MRSYITNPNRGIYNTTRFFHFLTFMVDNIDRFAYQQYVELMLKTLGKEFVLEYATWLSEHFPKKYIRLFLLDICRNETDFF